MPMSINRYSRVVNEIIQRAADDAAFRSQLISNPSAALSGYNLSDSERADLSNPATVKSLIAEIRP